MGSILDSCTNYKLYVDKAKELKQKAICFTNHGTIYNWVEKKMYCDENNIKYLHGVEIYLTDQLAPKIRDNYHAILIAKNYNGVLELNKLIDLSTQEDHFYYKPRISFDEFLNISNNIIKISACLASPINKSKFIIKELKDKCKKMQEDFDKISKDVDNYENISQNHYTEINDINNRITRINKYIIKILKHYDYYEIQAHNSNDQIEYNKQLYELSIMFNKPLIAATDTHSLNKYKAECRSILQKAKKIEYSNEDEFDLTYKSYDELVDMFEKQNCLPKDVYLEAILNTNVMADSVESFELDFSFKYPKFDNAEETYKALINEKYKYKLKNNIIKNNPQYKKNIQEEFRVFKKLNMISFMLFMSELITWCKENDIPVGPGRGSVGGSTIAYITDITDCDPIIWNTVFSRFCNEDRLEIGDIDIDYAPSDRQKVYDYIINRFGIDYTAYVLAIGTISDKGTIDEIGRALDFIWKEKHSNKLKELKLKLEECGDEDLKQSIEQEIKEVEETIKKESPYSLRNISEIKKEYEEDPEDTKRNHPDIFYYFDGLVNTAVSQSMHPAGIIVSPISLPDNYGTFWNKGKRIICINMEEVHEVSLVKYDILGLKNIEIIRDTCKLAGINYPLAHEINWEDKDVWDDMITSPVGIFQFESGFSFDLLCRYKPTKINDMNLVNACLRPSGASYRDNLITKKINENPSELIDNLLKNNLGYLVFQEDTIKFLQDICGFSGSEADNVRRAIGRKQKDRIEEALPKILEGYCLKSNKPRDIAEEEAKIFLKIIEQSSDYQFGYNHSTQYSMIGYLCAMLRFFYPLEFITAFLNNANNKDDITSGIELAKLKNIKIKPIKFRYSDSNYSFDKKTNSIYQGIASIKFSNSQIADELYELRDNFYSSFIDLLIDIQKTSIDTRKLEILIRLDFFSEFGKPKKLYDIFKLFLKIYNKKTFKKEKLPCDESIIKKYADETEKTYKNLKSLPLLIELCEPIQNLNFDIDEQLKFELEYLGYCQTIFPNCKYNFHLVTDLNTKYTPKIKTYNLTTGKENNFKISKKLHKENILKVGDIIQIHNYTYKTKKIMVNGEFKDTDEKETWITNYTKPSIKKLNEYLDSLERNENNDR